jgi:hypothetical protein
MHRFIDGEDRMQQTLLPHCLEDHVGEENPVRVIEVFIEELDLAALGFSGVTPAATGRPGYHPSTLLKIYLYGYLNRLQSSRRLEREAQRNIELMWLTSPRDRGASPCVNLPAMRPAHICLAGCAARYPPAEIIDGLPLAGRATTILGYRMAEIEVVDQLKEAVENMHGGTATLAQSVPVGETFEQTARQGEVYIFDLAGHPTATRAYAWSSLIEGSTKRRFHAVLHIERTYWPVDAAPTRPRFDCVS